MMTTFRQMAGIALVYLRFAAVGTLIAFLVNTLPEGQLPQKVMAWLAEWFTIVKLCKIFRSQYEITGHLIFTVIAGISHDFRTTLTAAKGKKVETACLNVADFLSECILQQYGWIEEQGRCFFDMDAVPAGRGIFWQSMGIFMQNRWPLIDITLEFLKVSGISRMLFLTENCVFLTDAGLYGSFRNIIRGKYCREGEEKWVTWMRLY